MAFTKEIYSEYLDTLEWQETRKFKLDSECHICEDCGDIATQVHHKTYKHLYDEPNGDLVALCDVCHKARHGIEIE